MKQWYSLYDFKINSYGENNLSELLDLSSVLKMWSFLSQVSVFEGIIIDALWPSSAPGSKVSLAKIESFVRSLR